MKYEQIGPRGRLTLGEDRGGWLAILGEMPNAALPMLSLRVMPGMESRAATLTQEDVAALLPYLEAFARCGKLVALPPPAAKEGAMP